jgi:hypothetical protein
MPLTRRKELRVSLFQRPRIFDRTDRNDSRNASIKCVTRNREGAKHIDDYSNTARGSGTGHEIHDLDLHIYLGTGPVDARHTRR